jgi:hypothetical protein
MHTSKTIQNLTFESSETDEVPQLDMRTIQITAMTLSFAKRVGAYYLPL